MRTPSMCEVVSSVHIDILATLSMPGCRSPARHVSVSFTKGRRRCSTMAVGAFQDRHLLVRVWHGSRRPHPVGVLPQASIYTFPARDQKRIHTIQPHCQSTLHNDEKVACGG